MTPEMLSQKLQKWLLFVSSMINFHQVHNNLVASNQMRKLFLTQEPLRIPEYVVKARPS